MFNLIQTFYLDSKALNSAERSLITSVELFFKQKPNAQNNKSGILKPGVTVSICRASGENPDPSLVFLESKVRIGFDQITAMADASIATKFTLPAPLPVKNNSWYGIMIALEDEDYRLWSSKSGDRALGTNSPSPGSTGNIIGNLFEEVSTSLTPRRDTDLKFKVNVARFTSNNSLIPITSDRFEFLSVVQKPTKVLQGGEYVIQPKAPLTGNVTYQTSNTIVIGTGTSFLTEVAANDFVAFLDNTSNTYNSNTILCQVDNVSNNTYMVLKRPPATAQSSVTGQFTIPVTAKVHDFNWSRSKLILKESNANSSLRFTDGGSVFGTYSKANVVISTVDNKEIHSMVPDFRIYTPANASMNLRHGFAYWDGADYIMPANSSLIPTTLGVPNLPSMSSNNKSLIVSRSNEVVDPAQLYNADRSAVFQANIQISQDTSTNIFDGPYISNNALDLMTYTFEINDNLDGENQKNGSAKAKHITKRLPISNTAPAEDILVYINAHRPPNSNVHVYAKVHNKSDPDSFDDKDWSKLRMSDGADKNSSVGDVTSDVMLTYTFDNYPESNNTLAGVVNPVADSATINGFGTTFSSNLAVGSVIKIYGSSFANNYQIGVVQSITNNTQIILEKAIEPTSVQGSVAGAEAKIDVLKYPNMAFKNLTNDNVSRYYNSSKIEFDGFDTCSLKIVLTSSNSHIYPVIKDLQAIGVTS
jgi:hypothetical protein